MMRRLTRCLATALLALPSLLAAQAAQPQAAPAPATPTAADTVRAVMAAARSDLRNLVVAQEAYFADHARYGTTLLDIKFVPTRGHSISFVVLEANAWSAELRHPRLRGSCVIFVGVVEEDRQPRTAADARRPREGEPLCDAQPELAPAGR